MTDCHTVVAKTSPQKISKPLINGEQCNASFAEGIDFDRSLPVFHGSDCCS
jgi:hypothetical protein